MSQLSGDPGQIKKDGWRQGSVLPTSLVNALRRAKFLPDTVGLDDVVIVVSHDCDVTNGSFDTEPTVELLPLSIVTKGDSRFGFNNPRRYQFKDNGSGTEFLFVASIHDRRSVSRAALLGYTPDIGRGLETENVKRLCTWIARRYTRAAFPDAFNERTKRAIQSFPRKIKSREDLLAGIYVLVSDQELPEGEKYEIEVWATMTSEKYDDPKQRTDGQSLLDKLEASLSECEGIEVVAAELRSEAEVSLDDLRRLKRWDFDSLSLRDGAVETLPPGD
jgi:hypothetical protein